MHSLILFIESCFLFCIKPNCLIMSGFFQNAFQVFFVFGLLLLFVVSIIILKPFRVHHKRPVTTITLKVSYVVFLLLFLVFTHLMLFGAKSYSDDIMPYDTLFNIHFLFFISATIVPNFGVMVRRSVKKKRFQYNIVFTIVNCLYITYFVFAIATKKWALL